jgi:hypothetical protein
VKQTRTGPGLLGLIGRTCYRAWVQFHPSHGGWIEILRASGFVIDALHELHAPPEAPDHPYYTLATADWARHWPVEEKWVAHLVH